MIPGIQVAGTSGPGGNSNIAVRGLPVATGGSPFVQIQEDGLPTVLFGDIQFGNNDYWTHFDASVERVGMDGIRTKATSVGGQLHYEFGSNITVDDNMRWTKMSGSFSAPFNNVTRAAGIVGSQLSLNGTPYATVGSIRYALGPKAGQTFTGTYIDNNVNVRTNIRDIGSTANDLALSAKFDVGTGAKVTVRGGFFYMNQKIAMDWHVDKSLREVTGSNPSQLDLYRTTGAKLTQEGISGYNNNWGSCCARDYDLSYTNTAPYAALELDTDQFNLDASGRFENVHASGSGTQGGSEFLVNSGGVLIPAITSNSPREVLNYSRSYTSWTAGALFKVNPNTSLFVRASRGGRFNGDRQTFGGKIASDGSLCTSAQASAGTLGCASDGVTPSVYFIKQYELGLKNRGELAGGRYTMELTLLKGSFKQSTFELSATRCPGGAGGCVIDARYKSYGLEFYGTYRSGGFTLVGNATYTKATRSGTTSTGAPTPFTRAPYLPDLIYTVQANYDLNDMVGFGVSASGQSNIIDDGGRSYPGGAVVGVNLTIHPMENLEFGIQGYNVFNRYDLRGSGNIADGSVTPVVIGTGPALGRTWTASVKLGF